MSQPSVSRHHADWLSLVEVSGPFVSLPVLMRVFPQGLEPRDPAQAKALRAAYEEWQDNPAAPGKQRAWVMHVLTAVLGYAPEQIAEGQTLPAGLEAKMPEMGETLRPDFALVGPGQRYCRASSAPHRQLPARAGARQARHRQTLEGHSRHPHDGAAPRHRRAARLGHQRRALDAGLCSAGRDHRLCFLVWRTMAG